MKKLIALLALSVILTGCFGGTEQKVDDGGIEVPVVEESSDGTSEDTNNEDGKDNEGLGELQTVEDNSSDEDEPGVEESEQEAEQEVIDEFENDLEDIFKDLGV